ncbi:hypothetical protein AOLI_G00067540 [Acnodon oligacanthus]
MRRECLQLTGSASADCKYTLRRDSMHRQFIRFIILKLLHVEERLTDWSWAKYLRAKDDQTQHRVEIIDMKFEPISDFVAVLSAHVETENPEPRAEHQSTGGLLAQRSPSTLRANLSAVDGGLISAPAFCSNAVSGDVNISNYFGKNHILILLRSSSVAVTQRSMPAISEDEALTQEADSDTCSKTGLRSPEKGKRKPQMTFHQNKEKSLRYARRAAVTCNTLTSDDVNHQLDLLALEEETEEEGEREDVLSSLTGEITGTRVTADYHCYECGSAIHHFRARAFSVKCTKCRHSWKCAKLQCTCTAEMTMELSDRTVRTVELSDSLLRSIVRFERQGYCNTDKIEKKVLKLGNVRVDFMDGHLKRVERIADHAYA